jgi:hypothetical protein
VEDVGKDEVDEGIQVLGGERDERKEDKTPGRMGGQGVRDTWQEVSGRVADGSGK